MIARQACYDLRSEEVFAAAKDLIADRYTLTRESGVRGIVEANGMKAELVDDTTAACVHEWACIRVRLTGSGADAKKHEDDLHIAIYARLAGP